MSSAHHWNAKAEHPRGLVRPVAVDPKGVTGPTRSEVKSGRYWRRSTRGLYVPVDAPDLPEQFILEQSMRLPAGGAITGWAGCRLYGAGLFDGNAQDGITPVPVMLAIGPRGNIRKSVQTRLSYLPFDRNEVGSRHSIPVLGVERCAWDAAREAISSGSSLVEAVVAFDMMQAAELTSVTRLVDYAATSPVSPTLRQALALSSEHSASPNESRLRMLWMLDASLSAPLINCPVFDRQRHLIGIADLLDEEAGLVVEFDGADHRGWRRHTADVAKDEALRQAGLEVTRVTGADLRSPDRVLTRLLQARRRAMELPRTRRYVLRPRPNDLHSRLEDRDAEDRMWREFDSQPLPDVRGW